MRIGLTLKRRFASAWLASCCVVILGSCASTSVIPEPAEITLSVSITRHLEGRWSVSFRTSQPVDAFQFGPPVRHAGAHEGGLREEAWSLSDGFLLASDATGEEIIRREDGAPFSTMKLELQSVDMRPDKDYVPFNQFSDGGVSLYLGHYQPDFWVDGQRHAPRTAITMTPRQDEYIVFKGMKHDRINAWSMGVHESSFAYFGKAPAIESDHLIAVFDPALPTWLAERFDHELPRIFDYLAERFDKTLEVRPMVFVSSIIREGQSGVSMKGGTQPNQIQIRLRGEGLRSESDRLAQYFDRFLAHEGAHLWQNKRATTNESGWVHEGGADVLAFRTMTALGLWSEEAEERAEAAARQECLKGLKETALIEAAKHGAFSLYYSCGAVIHFAVEQGLASRASGQDIFDFWVELNTLAGEERVFDQQTFVEAYEVLTGDKTFGPALEVFLTQHHDDPVAAIDTLMAASG